MTAGSKPCLKAQPSCLLLLSDGNRRGGGSAHAADKEIGGDSKKKAGDFAYFGVYPSSLVSRRAINNESNTDYELHEKFCYAPTFYICIKASNMSKRDAV